jgi:hypothetical protein
MQLAFLTEPVPHAEAARRIASKPAVAKDVFDQLPDEIKGRAFTITGIEDFDTLEAVRDEIAKLPAGADWDAVKRNVMEKISPWFSPEAAAKRAQLLMSHHAFAAYSATQARIMDEMADIFPFRQYLSTKDGKVRRSHAALNEIILPADHPFWEKHTPPWEWNCRCQVVELTEEDRDEELARDQTRAPENRRVLQGAALNQLQTGSLNRGLSINVDVRTPKERGGSYEWSARDAAMPYAEIRKRWTPEVAEMFENWADTIPVGNATLLDSLTGAAKVLPVSPAAVATVPGATVPGATTPVSAALDVRARKPEPIKEAIALIDQVHTDGVLPPIPVTGAPSKASSLGEFAFQSNGTASSIAVRVAGPWPRMTTAHEIGHFIDHQGFGKTPGFATNQPGPLKDLVDEIAKGATAKRIIEEAGSTRTITYMLDPNEIWARAYAQFVAVESGDATMLAELEKIRESLQPWRQWPDDEFEGIRQKIKTLFQSLKWIP